MYHSRLHDPRVLHGRAIVFLITSCAQCISQIVKYEKALKLHAMKESELLFSSRFYVRMCFAEKRAL